MRIESCPVLVQRHTAGEPPPVISLLAACNERALLTIGLFELSLTSRHSERADAHQEAQTPCEVTLTNM